MSILTKDRLQIFSDDIRIEGAYIQYEGETKFQLDAPLAVKFGQNGHIFYTALTKGFLTDFASIPWFARWRYTKAGRWNYAAAVHDWLLTRIARNREDYFFEMIAGEYTSVEITRKEADDLFYALLRATGVSKFDAYVMWLFVRLKSKIMGYK